LFLELGNVLVFELFRRFPPHNTGYDNLGRIPVPTGCEIKNFQLTSHAPTQSIGLDRIAADPKFEGFLLLQIEKFVEMVFSGIVEGIAMYGGSLAHAHPAGLE
jgi:hypothetical protein